MKNLMIGMTGFLLTIYVVLIMLNLYIVQVHKSVLENHLPGILENCLTEQQDEKAVMMRLQEELSAIIKGPFEIRMKALDHEKGILSVEIVETCTLLTGKQREIAVEKTVLVEKEDMRNHFVSVRFMIGNEIYKEYELEAGETCPMPKEPFDGFSGWIEYGSDSGRITAVGPVWEDKIYMPAEG